jgi:hypothetical protein
MSCATVASVLEANNIPYEKLDIGDPDLFFKPGNWPVTYFFVEDDSCWPRGDVFDTDMLNWHLNNIKEIKKQNG